MSGFRDSKSQGSTTPLCRRCAGIDIDGLLRGKEYQVSHFGPQEAVNPENKPHLNLGPASSDSFVSSCGLCQFFVAISPSQDLGPRAPNQTIVVRDISEENFGQLYSGGMFVPYSPGQLYVARECTTVSGKFYSLGNAFCAVESLSLSDSNEDGLAKGRIIKSDCIDYSVIRGWIGHCKETHAECLSPPFMPLKVIDCKRRIITKVPDRVTYVALSYVWGSSAASEEPPSNTGQLPTKLPATVEDAITVTLALGYDYIWVDRYCISQHGGDEKAQEIARMDEIYQGAEIVIIDASGDDPALGLSGVSRQRSVIQPHVAMPTHTLVSLMSYPLNHVLASKWTTRGWTYQEGVLAKRRVFFTNQQVYFECGVYGCMETLCQPLVHPPAGVASIRLTNVIPDIKSAGTIVIGDYLREYSKRQLSYSSDALNAFRGIFHMFERQTPPILHCGGVPLLNNDSDLQVSTSVAYLLGFLRGLCWFAPWEDAVKRPEFPSWSWTGWQCAGGGVNFHQLNFPIYCSLSQLYVHCDDKTIKYPIEHGYHTEGTEQGGASRLDLSIPSSPGALYMTGNVVTFHYLSRDTSGHFCSGSATRSIRFEHKNNPSRTIGKCDKPVITHLYNAGIPGGPQSLSAIEVARSMNPSSIEDDPFSLKAGKIGQQTGKNGLESFILVLLLLKEIQDASSKFAPHKVFRRVGLVVLNFTTFQNFQRSDWFSEAVEERLVIV